ncbi:hypothetical protein MINTMi27_14820 [Mycobacterium intracellulare]|nr:hypothetical protein MINTMi27_14820 [Mycobacterium intracellulare]
MQLSIVTSYQVTDEKGFLHATFSDEKEAQKYVEDRKTTDPRRRVNRLTADCRDTEWECQKPSGERVRYRYNHDTQYWQFRSSGGPWKNSMYSAPYLRFSEYVELPKRVPKPRRVTELTPDCRDAEWVNSVTGSTYRYNGRTWEFKRQNFENQWYPASRMMPKIHTPGHEFVEVVD